MKSARPLGGIIHTYQKYDPKNFPSPTQPPPDLVSGAFNHMLSYGSLRELTDEDLARAVKLDPSQIAGLGPSLEYLIEKLRERKRKILETYETRRVQAEAAGRYRQWALRMKPPLELERRFKRAFAEEQLYDLERLWYGAGDERSPFARELVQLVHRLGDKYQIDELASKYEFTGRTEMSIPRALEIKEELETIDRLLKQLEEAMKTARVGIIDLDELRQFVEQADVDQLKDLARQVEDYVREMAEQQGLEKTAHGYQLTPKAYRVFQGRLLERIFSNLESSRTGRHHGPVVGEGAVELQQTKPYEFGDSIANMDIPGSMINAMIRNGPGLPVRLSQEDVEIHRTRNTPKCASVVLLDMSGSMRYEGLYVDVKRMGLALDGLIRREYPGDYLQFVEMASFAKPRHRSEIAGLMPKPVTIYQPIVQLYIDMSDERVSELDVPPHFTNIQHALQLARRLLSAQDTPNRRIILITDGLPTAHFEEHLLYLLYPPHERTEGATLREGLMCRREGITINIFLLPSWSQSREDVQFAYRLAESTAGKVFFTAGKDLDRYVVWDYLNRRREIVA
jgi:uncharacterized protein with von Willebrand factor type A (vWA) domain